MTPVPLSQSYLLAAGKYPLSSDEVCASIWIPFTEEWPWGQVLQNIAPISWKLIRRYCEIGFLLETEVGKGEELISGPRKPWRSWGPPYLETGMASHKSWYVTSLLHQESHTVWPLNVTQPQRLCVTDCCQLVFSALSWRSHRHWGDFTSQYQKTHSYLKTFVADNEFPSFAPSKILFIPY